MQVPYFLSLPPSHSLSLFSARFRFLILHFGRRLRIMHFDRFYESHEHGGLADIMKAINLHASDFPIAFYELGLPSYYPKSRKPERTRAGLIRELRIVLMFP